MDTRFEAHAHKSAGSHTEHEPCVEAVDASDAWVAAWVAWVAATPSVVGTHRAVARGIPEAVGDTACAPDVIVDAAEHAACCVPGDA